jgi:hypothetical protein
MKFLAAAAFSMLCCPNLKLFERLMTITMESEPQLV